MTYDQTCLAEYGWSNFFNSQLDSTDFETLRPVRVTSVHRDRFDLVDPQSAPPEKPVSENSDHVVDTGFSLPYDSVVNEQSGTDIEDGPTVGDWLMLNPETQRVQRRLDRKSLFQRIGAGHGAGVQLIAANVDTLFIATSCDQDFNLGRLERYLALANEAGVMPIIVLTKADLAEDTETYRKDAASLMPGLLVECVNAKDPTSLAPLEAWCGTGQTLAVLGSSGVGKSTMVNALGVNANQQTQGVREDDAKGRHTTTNRSIHRLRAGGWLIDTPGMRELQLNNMRKGIGEVFADIEDLVSQCRFSDCGHDSEPGCAINEALSDGTLEQSRFERYLKLLAEDARNTETIAERRSRSRKTTKYIKSVMSEHRHRKGR